MCHANSVDAAAAYLPKHKAILKHANLLLFAQQIANGMVYLEQQRYITCFFSMG